MVTLRNKKELNSFVEKIPEYVNILFQELDTSNSIGKNNEIFDRIDDVQRFYENNFKDYPEDKQNLLQISFWAFCAKILMDKLGGELVLGTKSDYGTGTPIYINYGNLYDKKGKKKWIGITFDTWFKTYTFSSHYLTLKELIESIIKKYQ